MAGHTHNPNIRMLQASVYMEIESAFRLLVDEKFVKCITIDGGIYEVEDMCFEPALVSLLPPLPPGDWNTGRISRHVKTGDIHFSSVTKVDLVGITKTWHPTQIDHLQLRERAKLQSNVYKVTCPGFSSTIVAKFARFEWEIPQMQAETTAFEWIEGQQIGPEFLGHLTEEGRVIRFLMARVPDCRHATPEDLPLCQTALLTLHKLGIKHGDTNKYNFLVYDRKVTLIDFDFASRMASEEELQAELEGLEEQLRDTSGRGEAFFVSDSSSESDY